MIAALIALGLAAQAAPASAGPVRIRAVPALTTGVRDDIGSASDGVLEGRGDRLRMVYSSPVSLPGEVTPFFSNTQYHPGDTLAFMLPAGREQEVEIDLTASTAWAPRQNSYLVSVSLPPGAESATLRESEIIGGSIVRLPWIALRHLWTSEDFVASLYHRARGYRALGVPMVPVLGTAMLIGVALVFVSQSPSQRAQSAIFLIIGALFLYQARVVLDELRWSATHLREWRTVGTYAQAADAFLSADAIRAESSDARAVAAICTDDANYYAKLIRYLLYPARVALAPDPALPLTHLIVRRKSTWEERGDRVRCGVIEARFMAKRALPAGTQLFTLDRSP